MKSFLNDLRSALDRLTSAPLAGATGAFILFLLLTVVGTHLTTIRPPSGGRIETGTGDFLAFWTGAKLLNDGQGETLYDMAAQKRVQTETLGGPCPSFQGYLNPPLLAVLLSILVPLGYLPAFYIYDFACLSALIVGLAALRSALTSIRTVPAWSWTLVFLIASFQPMLLTTFCGQNTPITFALLAAMTAALRVRSDAWAMILLGLLTYKPQYAIGVGLACLVAGRTRIVLGGSVIGIGHWLLGAYWSGPSWPLSMLKMVKEYRPLEMQANAYTHFSWISITETLLPAPWQPLAAILGVSSVLGIWWRFRENGKMGNPVWMALVLCGTMLLSPHQQYYDVAILTIPVAILINERLSQNRPLQLGGRLLLASAYLGYPAWEWGPTLKVQPLFFVLVTTFGWAIREAWVLEANRRSSSKTNGPHSQSKP